MVHLAAVAFGLAERLGPGPRGSRPLADLQARALAALGNARRVANDLLGAEVDLFGALERFEAGTGNPLLLAEILTRLAQVYITQRRFEEARRLLNSTFRLYLQRGKAHEAGEERLRLGLAEMYDGASEAAANHLFAALPLLDPEREPKAIPFCLHNLAWNWAAAGEFEQAKEVLWLSRELIANFPDPLIQAKVVWLDGRIAAGLGHHARAEHCFKQARQVFLGRKLPYTAAVVALDLAVLWLESGRTGEARGLVAETLGTFRLLHIEREAIAAVLLLAQAASQDCLTIEILQTAAAEIQKVER